MKNLIFKVKYVVPAICILAIYSCSDGEDGAIGPEGPQGEQGITGVQGEQGIPGTNGQDGNSNVQTYVFDTSADSGTTIRLNFPELTQDVLDNDVVLTYVLRDNNKYYPIPGISINHTIEVELALEILDIFFYERSTGNTVSVSIGKYPLVKTIIIESTKKSKSSKYQILKDLEQANVDIYDYDQVVNYYGLKD